ncbi:MAG: hypothetical protein HC836_38840, partial [Richelia sp. RM2_1_2]|nr:hypothetical protein [Richelia sp. RM2_1_2]
MSSLRYITNLGNGDKYNISIQSSNGVFINKKNNGTEEIFSADGGSSSFLGNGLWESYATRFTVVGDNIYYNDTTSTESDSPLSDKCRPPNSLDTTNVVRTWTFENPRSEFRYTNKLCGIIFNKDPDIGERNPPGVILIDAYGLTSSIRTNGQWSQGEFDDLVGDNDFSVFNVSSAYSIVSIVSGSYSIRVISKIVEEDFIELTVRSAVDQSQSL